MESTQIRERSQAGTKRRQGFGVARSSSWTGKKEVSGWTTFVMALLPDPSHQLVSAVFWYGKLFEDFD